MRAVTTRICFSDPSESAAGEWFQAIDKKHRVFQAATSARRRGCPCRICCRDWGASRTPRCRLRAAARPSAAERHVTALEEISSPTVLIDERWNVLHLSSSACALLSTERWTPGAADHRSRATRAAGRAPRDSRSRHGIGSPAAVAVRDRGVRRRNASRRAACPASCARWRGGGRAPHVSRCRRDRA